MSASRTLGRYFPGAAVRMRATFCSTDLITPADPSTVIFKLIYPDNSVACALYGVGSVVRVATGAYYSDTTASVYGNHAFDAIGTGGIQAVDEWTFEVKHSRFVL